jgi:hypothetical protein
LGIAALFGGFDLVPQFGSIDHPSVLIYGGDGGENFGVFDSGFLGIVINDFGAAIYDDRATSIGGGTRGGSTFAAADYLN